MTPSKPSNVAPEVSAAAAALGRLGGRARAESLTPERLSAIARKAGRKSGRVRAKSKKKSARKSLSEA